MFSRTRSRCSVAVFSHQARKSEVLCRRCQLLIASRIAYNTKVICSKQQYDQRSVLYYFLNPISLRTVIQNTRDNILSPIQYEIHFDSRNPRCHFLLHRRRRRNRKFDESFLLPGGSLYCRHCFAKENQKFSQKFTFSLHLSSLSETSTCAFSTAAMEEKQKNDCA